MERLLADVRLAIRVLARRPAFTIVAVLTLASGVGANTVIFALINGVVLKPLPHIVAPGRLVEVSRVVRDDFADVSYPVFDAMRGRHDVLEDGAGYAPLPLSIATGDEPAVGMGMTITPSYFATLGVRPAMGRFFATESTSDPANGSIAVISDRVWRERLRGDPAVLGRVIRVNGHPLEIVGVTPPGFRGHAAGLTIDVYVALGAPVPGLPTRSSLESTDAGVLQVVGRLRPNVSARQAHAALTATARRTLEAIAPMADTSAYRLRVDAFSPVPVVIRGAVTAFLAVLLALSVLLVALTCINVAGMLLSRAADRRTEIAVRRAVGASRGRIVRQLMTESVVLFVVAGVVGVVVASIATPLLLALTPPLPAGFTVDLSLDLDWRVFANAAVVALVTALIFSAGPALRATEMDLAPALRESDAGGGRGRTRFRGVLVGAQTAASALLLVVAGLFARAVTSMHAIDPGWDARGVYVTPTDLELAGFDESRGRAFFDALLSRVAAIPGVQSVALASKLPFSGQSSLGAVNVEGLPAPPGRPGFAANFNRVSPGYFRTMGIALLRGRDIATADGPRNGRVAVINQAMAERLWPGGDPVGRRFWIGTVGNGTPMEVIGVVKNSKYRRLTEEPPNFYFVPARQYYNAQMVLHVRAAPSALAAVRRVFTELAPALPVESPRPLREALEVYFLPQRLGAWLAGIMGVAALCLGALGAYGVAAISVAQRRRELGIRAALGAGPADVIRLILRHGLRAPAIGLGIGLALALLFTRLLRAFLGPTSPGDPLTFVAVLATLIGVTAAAIWLPARRAARIDPALVLREQ